MKLLKPGGAYYAEFTTQRFDSGVATNADSLPTVVANKNGVDDAAFVLTAANIDAGRYKITGTVPVGYVAGDFVIVTVSATVNAIAGKGVVDSFQVVTGLPGTDAILVSVSDKTGFSLVVTPPTKEEISTKVWGETARALTDKAGFALAIAPPTKEEIDTELTANHGSGTWGSAAGSGATLKTYTQLYGGLPLADCEIWVSTDLLQTNIIASGVTDALGKVYLYPNVVVGTPLYIWRRKTGYVFSNPDLEAM